MKLTGFYFIVTGGTANIYEPHGNGRQQEALVMWANKLTTDLRGEQVCM